jgi:glucose-1-phosphate adenylyltransferase
MVLAMILAGGQGKRMDVLCHERPKPILPFAGRFRVIDFSLSNCINSGVRNIAVLTDYRRDSLKDYLDSGAPWGLDRHGKLEILEPRAGSYQGTADAVYQNLSYIDACGADLVLILAADHVYKMDYRRMIAFHQRTGADVTVGVTPVPIEEAHRFGLVNVDEANQIQKFMEKPRIPQSNLASMGIYVFRSNTLFRLLAEDAQENCSPHDFGLAVIPRMVQLDKAFAYKFEGYWQDIGTVESYYQANMGLAVESPPFSLDGDWPIFTRGEGPSTSLASNMMRNSLISPGCMVKGRVENSVLSPGVRVESEAVVRESLVMRNCVIGRHSVVEYCILDEGVTVGEYSYVGFGTRLLPGNREITIVGKRAIIPSHSAIGRNCKIYPGVDRLDFKIPVVPAGTVISRGEVSSHILNVGAGRAAHRQGHGALLRRQADAEGVRCSPGTCHPSLGYTPAPGARKRKFWDWKR